MPKSHNFYGISSDTQAKIYDRKKIINPISHRLKQHSRSEDPVDDLPDNEEDDDFVLDEQGDPLDPLDHLGTLMSLPYLAFFGPKSRRWDCPLCK